MFVDLDHVPVYILGARGISVPFNVFHFGPGRFLHPALFFVGCAIFACAGGLLLRMVLKDLNVVLAARRPARVRLPGVGTSNGLRAGDASTTKHADAILPGQKKVPKPADK